jgi:hypothetical protein
MSWAWAWSPPETPPPLASKSARGKKELIAAVLRSTLESVRTHHTRAQPALAFNGLGHGLADLSAKPTGILTPLLLQRQQHQRNNTNTADSQGADRTRTAASMLAGDVSLGSENREITDRRICSTPRMGRQRSSADSCELKEECTRAVTLSDADDQEDAHTNTRTSSLNRSTPGGCRIEMHTFPSG